MEDNIQLVIIALVAIVIMFIFPTYIAFEKLDDITYALALKYTMLFVDEVKNTGYIDKDMYSNYVASLKTTGNSYDIVMEHNYERIDSDGLGGFIKSTEVISKNEIIEKIDETGYYVMNVGDSFNVIVRNNNTTPATVIFNMITFNSATNIERIFVNYGGIIGSTKWKNIENIDDKIYIVE